MESMLSPFSAVLHLSTETRIETPFGKVTVSTRGDARNHMYDGGVEPHIVQPDYVDLGLGSVGSVQSRSELQGRTVRTTRS